MNKHQERRANSDQVSACPCGDRNAHEWSPVSGSGQEDLASGRGEHGSDVEVWEACLADDAGAWAVLIRRLTRAEFAHLCRGGRQRGPYSTQFVEDAVQDVLCQLARERAAGQVALPSGCPTPLAHLFRQVDRRVTVLLRAARRRRHHHQASTPECPGMKRAADFGDQIVILLREATAGERSFLIHLEDETLWAGDEGWSDVAIRHLRSRLRKKWEEVTRETTDCEDSQSGRFPGTKNGPSGPL
jgi:hypothetical protein